MRINSSLLHRAAAILLVAQLLGLPVARSSFDLHEFDQRCTALFKVANYLIHRPHQMNVDGLFGITLAEANLIGALNHPNVQFLATQHVGLMANILQFLERARIHMKSIVLPANRDVALMNAILNEPALWIRPIIWKRGVLRVTTTVALNRTIAEELIFRGSPQERESDSCIGELLRGVLEKRCKVSDDCTEMLLRRDDPAGYPLTHRLLYVQSARALNCQGTKDVPFFKLITGYCDEILQNLVDLEATEFPGVSRDLAIEQVLLCGMEGFMDFANDHYANLLRSWAHPAGCYNSRGFDNIQDNLNNSTTSSIGSTRRSAEIMDFGCENHASGLAAGSLALLVRENVENAFQPPYNYNEKLR